MNPFSSLLSALSMTMASTRLVSFAGAIALIPTAALADYKLQPGDTLEVSVPGIPDFRQRLLIGVDGEVNLALVGTVQVSGLSIQQAQDIIAGSLTSKQYRQGTADGREITHLIQADQVFVSLAEYRPIYVYGDVARPGEYIFRPGMTVRQAVAVAGGYSAAQVRIANPLMEAADFRSEYKALWAQFATEQARIWRLRTELGEEVEHVENVPVPEALAERLKQTATAHIEARLSDSEKDKELLRRAVEEINLQLGLLSEKKKKDEEGSKADTDDYESVRMLLQKGLAPTTRLSEARRAVLMSSTQLLDTIVQASNIERQRGEYVRQLNKIDSERQIAALGELQVAYMNLAQISARLEGTAQKLALTGQAQSTLLIAAGRPEITVHREREQGAETLPGSEDLGLAPGDVVEVVLPKTNFAGALAPSPRASGMPN
ncbi:exopolysaccharide biosynthesis protein [Sinorhizobium meliloti]|uniref:polysaccharide biosynthesis/export family protein n=1 Tax=Rhizobium meliloti TaxID=382 RepID=UPI000FD735C4|nr:polysaccharide biosynthesis/export family protein [Sinorhizobium meliloti]MDW9441436.1 exopolysaccharide biosynthesis protein [Sinorhizobium meliloti]MDW9518646.1 exopolysaccharide biosynthesis protein [Sinorhizobium meliloti]MDW9572683.1 exopolysaccharide biosynthesis protein [Sinorhizobium meliloti]MDX0282838.1 exopolysaccharide biosynthesis protein [Sinorhizobium meliloti]MDX0285490.1 exopolysaccharide biosynthesis protein [Sinorhizobium meliloti]